MRLSLDPPPSRVRSFARDATRPAPGAALRRAAVVVASAALLALATGCTRSEEAPPAEVRPVRTVTIEKRSAGDTLSLTGTVQAQKEVNLSFRIDGRMIGREVGVGDAVRQGQAIARLDSQNEESNLQAARAQLAAARARLAEARNNHERFRDLVAENAVSRASFEQAESALKAAESQVESAVTQVTLAENRLSYTRLVSEVAGVVTMVGAEPGEIVGPGRMIVQVAREGARDAVFDVPARVHDLASATSRISVALTSDPKVVVAGSVREVAPRADPVTGTFRVRVRLENPPPSMRLGATVSGRLSLAAAPAIEIPPSAVTRIDSQPAVFVVDRATGTVSTRPIEIRSSDPNRVEVGAGLAPGDVVVTAGVQALRPGQKVRLVEGRK